MAVPKGGVTREVKNQHFLRKLSNALAGIAFAWKTEQNFRIEVFFGMATLAVFGADMRRSELVLAYLVGSFAVMAHLSHFPVAGLVFLAAVPLAFLTRKRRWWLGPAVIVLILATAWAQQAAFRLAAQKVAHSEVVIRPFLTARLIQDGPGYAYLQAHCPDAAIVTCRLWDALQISTDPYRLTASHIVFESSRQLGSFLLMNPDDKKAVADDQVHFLEEVVKERPLAVALAFGRNVLAQAGMVSVDMTLPSAKIEMRNAEVGGALTGPLAQGRLRPGAAWLPELTRAQSALYVASLVFALDDIAKMGLQEENRPAIDLDLGDARGAPEYFLDRAVFVGRHGSPNPEAYGFMSERRTDARWARGRPLSVVPPAPDAGGLFTYRIF